ncbi:retrovirus-related pol polyprotein from transposon TNT 1-94 [Tanacetum coccineum]
MERFEKTIFKQREEINDRMAEMFGLLKELTTSRTPEKVLVREEARHPITKNVNAISLVKMEKEKNIENNEVVDKNIVELSELNAIEPKEEVDMKKEVGDETNDELVGNMEEEITGDGIEELVEMPRSQPVGYYLKHAIMEKPIKGLIGNQRYNDSLLATYLGKMDYETYNSLPVGPMYNVILQKKITKKEDMGGNFVIPCIVKDVLVEIAGYIYLVDFVILDVKEDKKKPFILGTSFLTTAKAEIRFDKETITLKYGKNKINFFKIPESLYRVKEGTKSDIDPTALTTTVIFDKKKPGVLRSFMWRILG